MRVLITSANAARAHRLKKQLVTDAVVLGDFNDLPAFMLQPGKFIKLPNPTSASYTHEMLTLCLDNDIETIYVLDSREAVLLEESRQLFKEYNIDIQVKPNEI